MKGTGIIRRVDDLGRIILPKDVRRQMGVKEGTPMEIFISDGGILLKRYFAESALKEMVKTLKEAVDDMCEDLEPEKAGALRRHIRDIQRVIEDAETPGAATPRDSK